ncbi:MAG: glycosyltransferase [Anaerolineae bacterium]|nr:glycosyltransferase [Anaerolineae bacterium]
MIHTPVICTIVAKNYLAHARALTESFLACHPAGRVFVLLVDRPEGLHDLAQEDFTTVLVEDIGIPEFGVMTFRYTLLELSTAVKPFFLEYLFQHYEYDAICYVDPDIYFYRPIDEIWRQLESYGIVLTPHLLGPLDEAPNPNEITILQAGVYNLGFIGLSRHPELEEFLHWWQSKLARYCVVAHEKALFVDQRWIDLVPGRFRSVHIHQDPGCNVAYWNLYHRPVEQRDGEYTFGGSPLKFYHFSGYSPDRPDELSRFQNRYSFADLPQLRPLFDGYRQRLYANEFETVRQWPYAFGVLTSAGVRIPDAARHLWRDLEVSDPSWNPFGSAADEEFLARLVEWLNEPVGKSAPPLITRLALAIHQQQPSLRRNFPDVLGRDRVAYARWFVTSVEQTYQIDPFFVRPMAASLEAHLGGKAGLYQALIRGLAALGIKERLERLLGPRFVGRVRGLFIPSSPARPITPVPTPEAAAPPAPPRQLGVNVVGYLRDETGVGESARATIRALHEQQFPLAWTIVHSDHARQNDRSVLHLAQGHPYDINLFYVNADQIVTVHQELGADFFAGKYNIGYWAWELDRFPKEWRERFQYLDEVWVGSRFVQNTLAHVAPIPVLIMGVGMDRRPGSGVTPDVLGLPRDRFVFLFAFDMLSYIERKNPYAVVEAYRRAFGPDFSATTLAIKVTRLAQFPEHAERLRSAVDSVSGLLIDRYLDRAELDGLFECCHAYVSLHRSEGFGMTIAEAMCLGKPVIATDYSGNTDYMNVANSYPVAYRLVELEQDCGPYQQGERWADPDLDHAAAQMRHVFEHYDQALQKGRRAAADIAQWYGREAMARKMIDRFRMIPAP